MQMPTGKENRILLAGLIVALVLPIVIGILLRWPAWVTVLVFGAVVYGVYQRLRHGMKTAADHVGALLDQIGLYQGNPVRDLTANRIAKYIEATGDTQTAAEIRRRFDTLKPDELPKKFPIGSGRKAKRADPVGE